MPTIHSARQDGGHASLCPPLRVYFDKFSSSRFSAVFANACMLACRSLLPVSSVNTALRRPRDRHAAMAGGVAVAVAGRPGRAGFRTGPSRSKSAGGSGLPAVSRKAPTPSGCPSSPRSGISISSRRASRGVDHGAAEEIGGCAGHRQQRRRDQAAGRGFRDRNRLLAARSVVRRSSRRWSTSSFMISQLRRRIRFSNRFSSVGLVGERVIDHANEILAGQLRRRPFLVEIGERLCRHHIVLALACPSPAPPCGRAR